MKAIQSTAARVMIICPEFHPEPGSTAIMISQLSRALAEDGYSVTVVTDFPNRPGGTVYPGYSRKLRQVEDWNGVRLIRCPNWFIGPRRRHRDRILENITFGLASLFNALREPPPDLLIVDTWPVLAVQLGFLSAKLRGVPVLYYVQDVYPEIAIDTGVFSATGLPARALLALDSSLFRQAAGVITISETMKELLYTSRKVPPDHISIVYNWVEENVVVPLPRLNPWRRRMGIADDAFVLTYAGTMGFVSGVDILIDVARQVSDSRVQILCVGEGPVKAGMMEEAKRQGVSNLSFYDFQDESDFPHMLAASDAFFLPMRPGTRDASVPSKLIAYLAAGRPVINATPPGAATLDMVRKNDAGIIVESGNAGEISQAVLMLAQDSELTRQLGANARQAFEQYFTFRKSYQELRTLIDKNIRESRSPERLGALRKAGDLNES